ncbi:glutamine--tRNA ligase [Tanacetum coccineum]
MIYIMNPLKELAERKGNVLYLAGRLRKDDVFVRKVPVDNCAKVKKVIDLHKSCSHIANVLSLRSVECDDNFVYLAFERVRGSLLSYVNDLLGEESDPKNRELVMFEVLRNVVLALLQVHQNGFIHGCVAPQNVLVRKRPDCHMIKLCGFGKCLKNSRE